MHASDAFFHIYAPPINVGEQLYPLQREMYICMLSRCSCVRLIATPWTIRLLCPWDSPGKNTGVGCHFLLQGIFLTQVSNLSLLCLLHWQQILDHCTNWEVYKNMPAHPRSQKDRLNTARTLCADGR